MKEYNYYNIFKLKNLLFLCFLTFTIACSSIKNNIKSCNDNPFEELDSMQRANQILNYKINVPKNWEKSKTSSGDWYFLKNKYIDSINFYSTKADLYIGLNKVSSNCRDKNITIENYVDYFVKYRGKWFKNDDFKYSLIKSKHKLYGDIYTLKYKEKIANNYFVERSFFLFFYENKGYSIQYTAKPKYYDKYISDVEKIINSFRILK